MPVRLRPTAPTAEDAILVGDPGRALLLAQELLEQPKMSNHARGLWGYHGETADGGELTIQSTGIGGPSAALVLADLAELGVKRAIRVGTCVGLVPEAGPGRLLVVREALAAGGSAQALGIEAGATLRPDRSLSERLGAALGDDYLSGAVVSVDAHPAEAPPAGDAVGADMQTAPLLAQAARLGLEDRGAADRRRGQNRRADRDPRQGVARAGREAGRPGRPDRTLTLRSRVSLRPRPDRERRRGDAARRCRAPLGRPGPRPLRGAARASESAAPDVRRRPPRAG